MSIILNTARTRLLRWGNSIAVLARHQALAYRGVATPQILQVSANTFSLNTHNSMYSAIIDQQRLNDLLVRVTWRGWDWQSCASSTTIILAKAKTLISEWLTLVTSQQCGQWSQLGQQAQSVRFLLLLPLPPGTKQKEREKKNLVWVTLKKHKKTWAWISFT